VNPAVFLFQVEKIFDLIILRVNAAGHFIGHPQKFCPVKAVIIKEKPK
jgi:hypothetical protein